MSYESVSFKVNRHSVFGLLLMFAFGQLYPPAMAQNMRDRNVKKGHLIIEREWKSRWYDVTQTTRPPVWVGQRIWLHAKMSDGSVPTSFAWSVPGSRIEDYSNNPGHKINLTNFSGEYIAFRWYDRGANLKVRCTVTVKGVSGTAGVTFNIMKPDSYLTSVGGNPPRSTAVEDWGDGPELSFGIPSAYGIVFKADTIAPVSGCDLCFVQLVNKFIVGLEDTSGWHYCYPNKGLDANYPYVIQPPGGPPIHTSDAPGQTLEDYKEVRYNAEFTMWLMFKPPGNASMWVPLRSVDWYWHARAQNVSGDWKITLADSSIDPTSSETTVFPEWSNNLHPLSWQPPL